MVRLIVLDSVDFPFIFHPFIHLPTELNQHPVSLSV